MSGIVKRLAIATAMVLAVVVAPATAGAASHPFLTVATAGIPNGPNEIPFDDPCGVAVDSEGHLYVSDYHGSAIDLFRIQLDINGLVVTYMSRIAQVDPPNWRCELAVNSAGDLYANDYHQGTLKYVPSVYPFGGTPPTYAAPTDPETDPTPVTGVAVDPLSDRLYVAHRTYVLAYEADGSPVLDGVEPLKIGLGSLGDGFGLAVSGFAATSGYVYVADAADDTVKVYDPATDPLNPVQTIDGAATPQEGFNDLTDSDLAIDDSTGQLFVVDNLEPGVEHPAAVVDVFDAAGAFIGQLPQQLVHGGPSGVAVDNSAQPTEGLIYITSGDDQSSSVLAFCPTVPISPLLDNACPAPSPSAVLEVARSGSGEGRVTNVAQGIECGVVCAREIDLGAEVSLFAVPRIHSNFTGWTVTGQPGACPGTGSCKVTINADTEVIANFTAIPQRTLTVKKAGSGAGTVTSSPVGVACGAACTGSFDQGTQVTLNPEAAPGSEFAGWSGGGCSGRGNCKVTLGTDVTVTANFTEVIPAPPLNPAQSLRVLAISVTGSGAGTVASEPAGIACGTPCSGAYLPGSTIALVATPDPESRFAGWSGCDASAGNRCTVSLGASRTVGAVFEEAPRLELSSISLDGASAVLTVTAPGPGSLSATGKMLKPAKAKAKRAGSVSMPISLTKAGKRALARKGRLAVKLTIAFKPRSGGDPVTLTKTITFKRSTATR